jgi:hypothetical protein
MPASPGACAGSGNAARSKQPANRTAIFFTVPPNL